MDNSHKKHTLFFVDNFKTYNQIINMFINTLNALIFILNIVINILTTPTTITMLYIHSIYLLGIKRRISIENTS